MKLLSKLRELRHAPTPAQEQGLSNHPQNSFGLGEMTVQDILRLHAETALCERLFTQGSER